MGLTLVHWALPSAASCLGKSLAFSTLSALREAPFEHLTQEITSKVAQVFSTLASDYLLYLMFILMASFSTDASDQDGGDGFSAL